MSVIKEGPYAEGLKFARLMMVMSSISPLFILWSIRGIGLIRDVWFVTVCVILAALPTALLFARLTMAKSRNDTRSLTIGTPDDGRSNVLFYLLAILLPFYRQDVDSWRQLAALISALVLIVFLFWHLNYHYVNLVIAILGYRVFTVQSPVHVMEESRLPNFSLISRRTVLPEGQRIVGYRLSSTVFWEKMG